MGISVPNDALGVLQDAHWSDGGFGYFPTYLLGTVLSVQIWNRVRAIPTSRSRSSAASSVRCTRGSGRTSTRSAASHTLRRRSSAPSAARSTCSPISPTSARSWRRGRPPEESRWSAWTRPSSAQARRDRDQLLPHPGRSRARRPRARTDRRDVALAALGRLLPEHAQFRPAASGWEYSGDEPDAFAPLGDVIDCLERYASSFGAPVREHAPVTSVRLAHGRFRLEVGDDAIEARNVVVTTGAFQQPDRLSRSRRRAGRAPHHE